MAITSKPQRDGTPLYRYRSAILSSDIVSSHSGGISLPSFRPLFSFDGPDVILDHLLPLIFDNLFRVATALSQHGPLSVCCGPGDGAFEGDSVPNSAIPIPSL